MTNFPSNLDDDSTLPAVNDNIDQIGADAINALRDAVFAIETTLGTNVAGSQPNLADRLGIFINPDGTPNASIIYGLGLVTLPITDIQISPAAGIEESKLKLDYRTQDLFNYIRDLARDVNLAIGWISVTGVKLEPHLAGALYRHDLDQIDVAASAGQFLNNVFRVNRNNSNSYALVNDINNELLNHQWADGSIINNIKNITTNDESTYPSNYAHVASGIFLDASGFSVIPQTATSDQLAWDFIDQNSIFTLGTRIQNLYANGISVNSTSSSLITDGYGQPLVPVTPAIAYLRGMGTSSSPVDDIAIGDDIIQFVPSNDSGFNFEEQFALVRVGDIVRVNYSNDGYFAEVAYIISEKKYIPGTPASFFVRIAGKNIAFAPNAVARIDKNLFNNDKQGVLAISGVNANNLPLGTMPSLIISNPRGAQCLGVGFNPDQFNENHYLLYLALYPTGNPLDGYTILPSIDVTGNQGTTPGSYTLKNIVLTTNSAFRQPGFNYRFIAFEYQGEFGIMLADAYNNTSFSILNGIVDSTGSYNKSLSQLNFPNNVIDLFPSAQTITTGSTITLPVSTISVASTAGFSSSGTISVVTSSNGTQTVTYTGLTSNTFTGCSGGTGTVTSGSQISQTLTGVNAPDPLGFGPVGAGVSSPPFMNSYANASVAITPTLIFPPLKRNNFYVNGTEQEKLNNYVANGQVQDSFGDGYWIATVQSVNSGASSVSVTYLISSDVSGAQLKPGKTLVVQPLDGYNFGLVNYGRFVISNVTFNSCPITQTEITVYDAVHAIGSSPVPILAVGSTVGLYFNDDSVSFNNETATDFSVINAQFKRYFEVYVDSSGNTFTHERSRFYPSGSLGSSLTINSSFGTILYTNSNFTTMDIRNVSSTLRGYQYGNVNKITLNIVSYSSSTGQFSGNLCNYNGTNFLSQGPVITGKIGEVTRFYDQGYNDYIDVIFEFTNPVPNFTNQYIDIQLFPSLALDGEIMILGSVEVNGTNVSQFQDLRQFGNTSEKQLTTSALDYIALPEQLLHFNGVIRGFDFVNNGGLGTSSQYGSAGLLALNGGLALVNGKINSINPTNNLIPALVEVFSGNNFPINFAVCLNTNGEFVNIVLTDFDSTINNPNSPLRVVTVLNVASSISYQVDSSTFSNLLNNRKDLTPLYIVSTSVSGAGTSTTTILTNIRDVRRFINDSDSETPAVLTDNNSQGNFKSIGASLNWLKFNANYQNNLQIKGTFNITSDPGLNFPLTIQSGGDNAAINFNTGITISGNVTFNNLSIVFNLNANLSNVTFNNCTVLLAEGNELNNIIFNNCTLTGLSAGPWTGVTINSSTIELLDNFTITNFISNNSTYTLPFVIQSFTLGNNVNFSNCTFNYQATTNGSSYNPADLVNAQSGMIYNSITTTNLSNIIFDQCTFNNTLADHFPFISFQLGGTGPFSYGAILTNVNITNNTFNNQIIANDIRAVIAITSTITSAPSNTTYPAFPKLVNVNISNNICNYDQMIVVSTIRIPEQPIVGSMLACVNCNISNNTCGVIAYMNAADMTSNNFNSVGANVGAIRDKGDQLLIEGNTCKLISNLDSIGQFIAFQATDTAANTDWVKVSTGACSIIKNNVNWILVGAASWTAGGLTGKNAYGVIISQNRLSPGVISDLNPYQDTNNSLLIPPNIGIQLRYDASAPSDFLNAHSIISDNILTQKNFLDVSNFTIFYGYDFGIKCEASANIYGNIINQVCLDASQLPIALGGLSSSGPNGGPIINCTNNNIIRGNFNIAGYIGALNTGATNSVKITDNIFDNSVINTSGSTAVGLNIPNEWSFRNNKNQTFGIELSLLDNHAAISNSGGTGTISAGQPIIPNFIHYQSSGGAFYVSTSYSTIFLTPPFNNVVHSTAPPGLTSSGQYTTFNDMGAGTSTTDIRTFTVTIPLDLFLPANCKIISAKLGVFAVGSNQNQLDYTSPNGTYNGVTVNLVQYNNLFTSNDTINGVLDVQSNYLLNIVSTDVSATAFATNSIFINTSTQESNLKSSTQYITTDASSLHILTGNNYRTMAEINLSYKRNPSLGSQMNLAIILSPLVITAAYK